MTHDDGSPASSSHLGKRFRSSDFKAGSLGWKNVNMNAMCQIWYVKSTCFQYKIHLPCFSSMICMLFDLFNDVEIYMEFSIVGLQASTQHGKEPRDFLPASPQGSEFHQRQVAIAMRGKGFANNLSYPP